MNYMWENINSLSLIAHFLLIKIDYPDFYEDIMSHLIGIYQFNIIDSKGYI